MGIAIEYVTERNFLTNIQVHRAAPAQPPFTFISVREPWRPSSQAAQTVSLHRSSVVRPLPSFFSCHPLKDASGRSCGTSFSIQITHLAISEPSKFPPSQSMGFPWAFPSLKLQGCRAPFICTTCPPPLFAQFFYRPRDGRCSEQPPSRAQALGFPCIPRIIEPRSGFTPWRYQSVKTPEQQWKPTSFHGAGCHGNYSS